MSWIEEQKWSDRFIGQITPILGYVFFRKAPIHRDMREATDLVMLNMQDTRVGVRMRRHRHIGFADEFTIRCSVPSGVPTELQKLVAGYGHYLFYGFEGECSDFLGKWHIIDLKEFRLKMHLSLASMAAGMLPGREITNHDGTTFRAFRYSDFPTQMIVAHGTGDKVESQRAVAA